MINNDSDSRTTTYSAKFCSKYYTKVIQQKIQVITQIIFIFHFYNHNEYDIEITLLFCDFNRMSLDESQDKKTKLNNLQQYIRSWIAKR